MSSILVPLLTLVAGCYCAPASWLDFGGSLGYESNINGTLGGHLKADRDGLSVNGTGGAIVGASWIPKLIARGHARLGKKLIAGDGSFQAVIDNSWQPSLSAELGRNSKGQWLAGAEPNSVLNNKLLLTPRLQLKTGDEARELLGIDESEIKNGATPQIPMYAPVGTNGPVYPYGSNPYGYNAYGVNPYGYNPSVAYANMNPSANGAFNPYAAYYAQAMAQSLLSTNPSPK